jgi:LacI family transcriptional regulator
MKATQQNIAARCGLSQATVSMVLSGRQDVSISPEARERILQAAAELKYKPRRRKTYTFGVLMAPWILKRDESDPYHSFYARFFHALGTGATEYGYHVLFESWPSSSALPFCVQDGKVDGVIIRGWDPEAHAGPILKRVPVVQLYTVEEGVPAPSVMPDDRSIILHVMRTLHELGHRRIGFFSFGDPAQTGLLQRDRHRAYVDGLAALGLPNDPTLCTFTSFSTSGTAGMDVLADEVVTHFLGLADRPTAVLSPGDIYMLPFMRRAQARGWRIPQDLSVVGFDNVEACRHCTPPLASVEHPIEAMAAAAVEELVRRIEDPQRPVRHIRFDLQLVKRASMGPPAVLPAR